MAARIECICHNQVVQTFLSIAKSIDDANTLTKVLSLADVVHRFGFAKSRRHGGDGTVDHFAYPDNVGVAIFAIPSPREAPRRRRWIDHKSFRVGIDAIILLEKSDDGQVSQDLFPFRVHVTSTLSTVFFWYQQTACCKLKASRRNEKSHDTLRYCSFLRADPHPRLNGEHMMHLCA